MPNFDIEQGLAAAVEKMIVRIIWRNGTMGSLKLVCELKALSQTYTRLICPLTSTYIVILISMRTRNEIYLKFYTASHENLMSDVFQPHILVLAA